jgi:hypothetical protein
MSCYSLSTDECRRIIECVYLDGGCQPNLCASFGYATCSSHPDCHFTEGCGYCSQKCRRDADCPVSKRCMFETFCKGKGSDLECPTSRSSSSSSSPSPHTTTTLVEGSMALNEAYATQGPTSGSRAPSVEPTSGPTSPGPTSPGPTSPGPTSPGPTSVDVGAGAGAGAPPPEFIGLEVSSPSTVALATRSPLLVVLLSVSNVLLLLIAVSVVIYVVKSMKTRPGGATEPADPVDAAGPADDAAADDQVGFVEDDPEVGPVAVLWPVIQKGNRRHHHHRRPYAHSHPSV